MRVEKIGEGSCNADGDEAAAWEFLRCWHAQVRDDHGRKCMGEDVHWVGVDQSSVILKVVSGAFSRTRGTSGLAAVVDGAIWRGGVVEEVCREACVARGAVFALRFPFGVDFSEGGGGGIVGNGVARWSGYGGCADEGA